MPVATHKTGVFYGEHPRNRRWMIFVDGENLTIRAQNLAKDEGTLIVEGPYHMKDTYFWIEGHGPESIFSGLHYPDLHQWPIRGYYYTSLCGDEDKLQMVRNRLWEIGFSPSVFKKNRQEHKAKGVDIAMATDMLSHAFLDNYDVAVLVGGDADYLPLVEAVKRQER